MEFSFGRTVQQKTDIRMDFLQWLQSDTSLYILSFLDDPADLVRMSVVSRYWRHFVIANGLSKTLCLRTYPQLARSMSTNEQNYGMINSVDLASADAMKWEMLERDHQAYASLLHALTGSKVCPKDCIEYPVSASSTNRYPDESVAHTLNPRARNIRSASYWSSKGQSDPAIPEKLVYKLRDDVCVIMEVDIRPFEAFFQPGHPIYSAKSVRFHTGYPKCPAELGSDPQNFPLQHSVDSEFVWTYTSPDFPMAQENRFQQFKLPEPVICFGGYLQIELLGRVQRQERDGLFYMCLCYVRVLGWPLFPAFDFEIIEPSGKFVLKYYPEKLDSIMEDSPSPTNENQLHPMLNGERLWEYIVILENLFHRVAPHRQHWFGR